MYDKIKCGTCWGAVLLAFGYGIWGIIAAADGPDGVIVPVEVAIPCMTAVILLALTSILMRLAAWVVQQVRRDGAETVAEAVRELNGQLQLVAVVNNASRAAAAGDGAGIDSACVAPLQYRRR